MISCYFDHEMIKRRTNVPRSQPGLPCPNPQFLTSINRLKHAVEQYFGESSFSISTFSYFLGITALKSESRQNLRKFKLFERIFHPGSDNGCHWHLHTALWNIWWIINEPCGQFDLWLLALIALFFTSIFFSFFHIFAHSSHLLIQLRYSYVDIC